MGTKRTTKADEIANQILEGARARLAIAEADVHSAHETLRVAEAVRVLASENYQSLQKSLAREPAKPKVMTPRKPRADKGNKRGLPPAQTAAAPANGSDDSDVVGGE